ncbi:MAG: bifunctional 3-(3-hydroxy-phenyl)propionate/3-hydroxycinnamic acid hydroxylase [Pseudomonadota bacterium]
MDDHFDVLVIGLGPVGGVLAALCAQSGLGVLVIDRDTEVYRLPRAVAMDQEVLRQVGLIGVADAVLKASRPSEGYEFVNKNRDILVARYQSGTAPTGYRHANLFHQPSFEESVRTRLTALPNARVKLGWELTGLEQNADGVTATIETPAGARSVSATYAVGCDGGRSVVRRTIGAGMRDLGFDEPWLVVDVKLAEGVVALSDNAMQVCDPDRPTTSTQSGPGRHRWEFMLHPGETAEAVTRPESIREWISSWVDPDSVTLERSAVYQFHGLVAETWRDRRIMIIGDAAHQMPPFLGQGLCSGVRDAANLAWKLAAVLAGKADESLLNTVQYERAPHVMAITEAAIALGKIVCITDKDAAQKRDRQFAADRDAGRPPPFPRMPQIDNGILDDAAAGRVLPEPFVKSGAGDDVRLDAIAGYAPLLILGNAAELSARAQAAIDRLRELSPELKVCSLEGGAEGVISVVDAAEHLRSMLGEADALLAKPDRIVFGSGPLDQLAGAWQAYLGGDPFLAKNGRPGCDSMPQNLGRASA